MSGLSDLRASGSAFFSETQMREGVELARGVPDAWKGKVRQNAIP